MKPIVLEPPTFELRLSHDLLAGLLLRETRCSFRVDVLRSASLSRDRAPELLTLQQDSSSPAGIRNILPSTTANAILELVLDRME